jgi:hypothetical protein
MITQATMIYGFGRVFFFLLNLNLLLSIFFYIVKKIVSEKTHVINLYKIHGFLFVFYLVLDFLGNISFIWNNL